MGINTVLQNNILQSSGGAVHINDYIPNGSFKMTDNAVIRHCSAGSGGAIYAQMSPTYTFYIGDNAVLEDNEATLAGGGLWFATENREPMTIIGGNVTIARNKSYQGGGIYINDRSNDTSFTIEGANIEQNTAAIGGGIVNIFGVISFNNVTLKNNSAENQGGAIYQSSLLNERVTTIENSIISSNHVSNGDGGALYFENEYVDLEFKIDIIDTEITENDASNFGGAIYNKSGSINLLGGSILENHASIGGGIYNE